LTHSSLQRNESPLRKIIAERRKHFEKAKEHLKLHVEWFETYRAMWREENSQGDDHHSEAQFLHEQRGCKRALKHELEIAEEGYKCLLDAERSWAWRRGF